MPFCPKCRQEFQDWVTKCLDCGVPLVSELPPATAPLRSAAIPPPPPLPPITTTPASDKVSDGRLVHIATAPNEAEAGLWASVLEENGIRSLVKAPRLGPIAFVYPWDEHREIYVLAKDAETASQVLSSLLEEQQPVAPEEQPAQERPSALPTIVWPLKLAAVLALFFLVSGGVYYFFLELALRSKRVATRWVKHVPR